MNNNGRTIRSVERTFDIIEVLRQRERATVSEIADAVDLSSGNAHHHLTTLYNTGYVDKDKGEYRLSVQFLGLGGPVRDQSNLFQHGREAVDQLAEKTGETVRLVTEQAGCGITIYQSTGKLVDGTCGGLGQQEMLHTTAAGKAILAHMPREQREACLNHQRLPQRTSNTITESDQLNEELDKVKADGVAFDDEEYTAGRGCIAAPVFQNDDQLLGAISLSAPMNRKDLSWFKSEGIDHLRHTSDLIKMFNIYTPWTK